jgi:phage terminase large subunit GpA-like protein
VDYGCWPPQPRTYFRQADARPTLRDRFPGQPIEAAVYSGLKVLGALLAEREWPVEAGHVLKIERTGIDAGDLSDVVYQFCRAVPYPVVPTKGFGVTASSRPVSEWNMKPGERRGQDWVLGFPDSGRGRLLKFDSNAFKTFTAERWRTPELAAGCVRLFGKPPGDAFTHELFADHLGAEYPVETFGRGRTVREWKLRPGQDNHLFDCVVGCAVVASFCGVKFDAPAAAGEAKPDEPKQRYRDIGDMYRETNPNG